MYVTSPVVYQSQSSKIISNHKLHTFKNKFIKRRLVSAYHKRPMACTTQCIANLFIYLLIFDNCPTRCDSPARKLQHTLWNNEQCFYILYRNYEEVGRGQGSSVGIATGYGLDGPGIRSWWGSRFSALVQTGPGAHPASCTMGTGSFPGLEAVGAWGWPPPPSSAEVLEKSTAIPLLSLRAVVVYKKGES